ncbi:DgyrCDS4335 [Dimorphilus gyrociliatus]|uniref:Transcription initiation factor IIB n=1 Tax=Dimorphilus gyrociliatus TaxID=2664684 RepID=A0A7I8VJB3_9ANNE|nr:DgyrCDS4335 [Dimorphilus gyrociliatus]
MAAKSNNFTGVRVKCPSHPDVILIEDYHAGDMVCPECGLVVGDRVVDVGSEWRTFSNEKSTKDASRVGAAENSLLEGGDLSTMIGMGTGSASFDDQGRQIYRNRRQVTSSERALLNGFGEIKTMADRLMLTESLSDRARSLFKQVHDTRSLKGRSTNAIASACLYIACRQEEAPRTFKEICAVSTVSRKDVGRVFKLILKVLETSVEVITTSDFMNRFCSNLSLSNAVQKAATHVAKRAVDTDLVAGRSPISIAAAAIYMASHACNEPRTPKEICDIAGVADVTIRQSYKLMLPHAKKLFPDNFNFAIPIDQFPQN